MNLTDPIPPDWLTLARERGVCEPALFDLSRPDATVADVLRYSDWTLSYARAEVVAAGLLPEIARLAPATAIEFARAEVVAAGVFPEIEALVKGER